MDRGAFLSALPFLQEAAWPPQDRSQVLLTDHVVSMEPLSMESEGESLGPAFFSSNDISLDPALFDVEIAICTVEGKANGSSQTTLSSVSPSPKTPAKEIPKERVELYLRMDKQSVFRVDCSLLKRIKVIPGALAKASRKNVTKSNTSQKESDDSSHPKNDKKDGSDSSAREDVKYLPPCLLFYFDSCCFRVFHLSACQRDSKDAEQVLHAALTKLQAVPCRDRASSFIETSSQATGSSATTSLEHGQREPESELKADDTKEDAVLRRIKRRHESLQDSWKGVLSLKTVLEMPVRGVLKSKLTCTQKVRETFGPLLTATAEDTSQAYLYTKPDAKATVQHCHEQIQQQQLEMNNLLQKAFPLSSKKRRGRGYMSATPQSENLTQPPPSLQEMVEQTREIMAKHKEAMETRHKLALLP